MDDTLEVQVITGARVDIQGKLYCCCASLYSFCANNETFNSLGPSIVQAELINEDYNPIMKKKNSAPAIQNGEEPLDENGVVRFPLL